MAKKNCKFFKKKTWNGHTTQLIGCKADIDDAKALKIMAKGSKTSVNKLAAQAIKEFVHKK
ncbi:MAG: hypothetical protein LBV53_00050 [Mycoplasmataceae bacterium]|jgi:predicted HicB family RNase H-like nuclease|nr:hypothetical protein [Mycoplasmataceae bacterium]